MPGRSIPGSGGRTDGASGESTSLSYGSSVTSPVLMSRSVTVLSLREIDTASQLVRASMENWSRNSCSLATRRLDSFSITPDT